MLARLSIIETGHTIGDEVLDEIVGEALIILEQPGRHAPLLVAAARHALETVHRLRFGGSVQSRPALRSA